MVGSSRWRGEGEGTSTGKSCGEVNGLKIVLWVMNYGIKWLKNNDSLAMFSRVIV